MSNRDLIISNVWLAASLASSRNDWHVVFMTGMGVFFLALHFLHLYAEHLRGQKR